MASSDLANFLIIGGCIAIPILAYTGNVGGFKTWADSLGRTGPNRCWPVGDGSCACSCHGQKAVVMGKARGCDDCTVLCNTGQAPDPPLGKQKCPPSTGAGGGPGAAQHRCWEIGNGRLACACEGKQWFQMGPNRTCSDCEASCRGTFTNYASSSSFATYPMKGLIVE